MHIVKSQQILLVFKISVINCLVNGMFNKYINNKWYLKIQKINKNKKNGGLQNLNIFAPPNMVYIYILCKYKGIHLYEEKKTHAGEINTCLLTPAITDPLVRSLVHFCAY